MMMAPSNIVIGNPNPHPNMVINNGNLSPRNVIIDRQINNDIVNNSPRQGLNVMNGYKQTINTMVQKVSPVIRPKSISN